MNVALTAFTRRGAALAARLARDLGADCTVALGKTLAGPDGYDSVRTWAGALIFVGACGIAVRAIAPYVRDKFTDPAVVCVDEAGRYAVPLLSGHVGGANELARRVAALTGGAAAIGTATDVNGLLAIDCWQRRCPPPCSTGNGWASRAISDRRARPASIRGTRPWACG